MSPETRIMSLEIYSHVAQYFESCRPKFVLHMHRTSCLHGWLRGFCALNSCPHSWILENSSNDDGEKAIGFKMGRTTTLHVHHALCTFLSRRCTTTCTTWKCVISCLSTTGTRDNIFFSWTLIQSFRIQLQKQIYNNSRIEWDGMSAIKFEATRIHFLSDVFVAVAVAVAVAVVAA